MHYEYNDIINLINQNAAILRIDTKLKQSTIRRIACGNVWEIPYDYAETILNNSVGFTVRSWGCNQYYHEISKY